MMKKFELNLNNPIFVVYINISGLSRQRAEELVSYHIETMDVYDNVTFWFMPNEESSKIECVYDGLNLTRNKELSNIINEINKRIDILSKCNSVDDFKLHLREFRLENILNTNGEK